MFGRWVRCFAALFGILGASGGQRIEHAHRTVVIAHRGVHVDAPENTLAAIRAAIDLRCDFVELDVRRTKDGALVLMHNSTVDGTTDGTGPVSEKTLAEMKALDAGARKGGKWHREQVPTFDEALALCRGKMRIYVDNKAGPPAEVIAAIEKHKMLDKVIIYDSIERLREFKRLKPRLWIMPDHPGSADQITALARELKPETLDGNLRRWTKDQVDAAHRAGVQVWVDNLGENDSEEGFRKALDMGVDAIQTDKPDQLIAFLRSVDRRR